MTYELICDNPKCGKEIIKNPHEYGENVFCSEECAAEFFEDD
jgi:hypothetical protein